MPPTQSITAPLPEQQRDHVMKDLKNKNESIEIRRIDRKGSTQVRQAMDKQAIADYADAVREDGAAALPPIDVFTTNKETFYLADGWHRVAGYEAADENYIPARVHQGGSREAILHAVGANQRNGLRRTNADKRSAVTILLEDEEWSGWSDNAIAERCGVSHTFVGSVRGQLETASSCEKPEEPETRIGLDGKKRRVKKAPEKPTERKQPAAKEPAWAGFAADHKEVMNAINQLKKKLKELAEQEPLGKFLAQKLKPISKDLDSARRAIRQSMPDKTCEKCNGAGCDYCQGTGFLTRQEVEGRDK